MATKPPTRLHIISQKQKIKLPMFDGEIPPILNILRYTVTPKKTRKNASIVRFVPWCFQMLTINLWGFSGLVTLWPISRVLLRVESQPLPIGWHQCGWWILTRCESSSQVVQESSRIHLLFHIFPRTNFPWKTRIVTTPSPSSSIPQQTPSPSSAASSALRFGPPVLGTKLLPHPASCRDSPRNSPCSAVWCHPPRSEICGHPTEN